MTAGLTPFITVVRIDTKGSITGTEDAPALETPIENLSKLTPKMMREKFGGETQLVYTMNVKALTKQGAVMRGKALVRAKNPFEFSSLDTVNVDEIDSGYNVAIGVTK